MKLPPCLMIESIEVLGDHVAADLQIGPRHKRIVIDLSMIDVIIGFVEIPSELDPLQRPKRALFDVMIRVYRGERVSMPVDLSVATRETEEPWPGFDRSIFATLEPSLKVEISKVERDTPEPGIETVHLNVLGVPTRVIANNRERKNWARFPTMFRFIEGVHPLQLSDDDSLAMFLAIDKVLEGGATI